MAAYFTTATFDFLQDLEVHNDRTWFADNKARYEADVREPMLAFITDLAAPLRKSVSKHLVADPAKTGGSMFRIHRDTRFSKDKTPYKTHVGAQFRHEQGRDVHAPGLYLHLEPGNCLIGVGMWMPDTQTLNRVRDHIVAKPTAWKRVRDAGWMDGWRREGDQLKRAPKGYDVDHPLIEDLRWKSWAIMRGVDENEATADDFLERYVQRCAEAKPWMRLLCTALDLPL